MIDDNTISDAARNPGDETQGAARAGVRATAKKTTRKVAKKTAKKAAKKAVKKTAKADERSGDGRVRKKTPKAGGRSGDGRARKKTAKKAAKPATAISAASETLAPDIAVADPATSGTAASDMAPPDTSASGAAASDTATPDTAADGSPAAEKRAPPADASRRFGPRHSGAHMAGTEPEDLGGLGGFLALWGPLIIVGFLVLVFRGGEEREAVMASDHDASAPASAMAPAAAGTEMSQVSDPAPDSAGAVLARAFGEAGASPMPTVSRVPAAWTDSGGAWPAPPGPYRNPRARELPAGERWAAHTSEWAPSAESRGTPGYGAGGGPPPQWVRCEAPYYWCPAPGNPVW